MNVDKKSNVKEDVIKSRRVENYADGIEACIETRENKIAFIKFE